MREIKFRGKRRRNNEWVYGNLISIGNLALIMSSGNTIPNANILASAFGCCDEVDAETAGQYIGLTDKNDTAIYEGDILKNHCEDWEDCLFLVSFSNSMWLVESYNNKKRFNSISMCSFNIDEFEIIGNIYENKELIWEV